MDKRLILAVDATELNEVDFGGEPTGGLIFTTEQDPISYLAEKGCWFGPREVLEHTHKFRQVIPYVVFRRIRTGTTVEFLTYRRSKKVEEQRLAGMVAIGFGGHVDMKDVQFENDKIEVPGPQKDDDPSPPKMVERYVKTDRIDLGATLTVTMGRELQEEIDGFMSRSSWAPKDWCGLIVMKGKDVNWVHVGVIGVIDCLPGTDFKPGEEHVTDFVWRTQEEILALPEADMEDWTGLVGRHLDRLY